jgi:hypothetical protein
MNRALWIVQGLLAALFMFGGVAKLTMPLDELAAMMSLPAAFIVFISVAEIAGSLGLILPGLLRIKVGLTPLAAAGLVIIMIGATSLCLNGVGGGDPSGAVVPAATGFLAAFVTFGRIIVPLSQTPRNAQHRQVAATAA